MQGLVFLKHFSFPVGISEFPFHSPTGTDSPPTVSMHCLSLTYTQQNTPLVRNNNVKFKILCHHGRLNHQTGSSQRSHENKRITVELQPQGTLVELHDHGSSREENKLRWRFISKVYGVLVAQVAFCASVTTAVILSFTFKSFLRSIHPIIALCARLTPLLVMWPMITYRKSKPLNIFMLAVFTMSASIALGIGCASLREKVVIQALITTAFAVTPITWYALWGSVSGQDFKFPVPFSFSCNVILMMTIIQLFYPLVSATGTLLAGLVGTVFAGFLVYDRDELIKRHDETEFIDAAICVYMDIINVFHCTFHVLRLIVEFHFWFFGLTE